MDVIPWNIPQDIISAHCWPAKKLLDIIVDTCLKKRGNLIIPAFSVGRTQEIIYALNRLNIEKVLPPIDFFVDSPLSLEGSKSVLS